jgi:hypothetical protein
MKTFPPEAVMELPFRVDSITPATAPEGSEGSWCRYVISQGNNRIAGLRAGTLSEVQLLISEMVEHLNERREGKPRPRVKA